MLWSYREEWVGNLIFAVRAFLSPGRRLTIHRLHDALFGRQARSPLQILKLPPEDAMGCIAEIKGYEITYD
jgi:hypothetical protein